MKESTILLDVNQFIISQNKKMHSSEIRKIELNIINQDMATMRWSIWVMLCVQSPHINSTYIFIYIIYVFIQEIVEIV